MKTHYTMKVLIHLALHELEDDSLLDIRNVSDELELPYEHVRKIVQDLVKLEAITSIRGRNGGIKLAKKTTDIHLFDLIMAIEEVSLDDFKHDCKNCNMPLDCKFRHMLKEQYKTFYMSFKDVYLSDIM
ncbi:Rrf2 family transcriptional regulator [Mollicutes bacterium LVI A0039]|nr:Rrf2 family transcriptional regulator [Mollicutes bacterium LVI A0039]